MFLISILLGNGIINYKKYFHFSRFIDDGEKSDLNGSGSDEDDYSGSSEESYERVPYMRNNDNGPHRSGSPPYYRRGKSLAEIEAKLKKKKIKKLAKLDTKSKNGTQTIELELPVKNSTKPLKVYSPAQIEQRAFIDRKTQELNVVSVHFKHNLELLI